MHSSTAPNDDLIRTRLPRDLKARVEQAAGMLGLDASAFVRQSIAKAAEDVLTSQTRHQMTPADLEAVATALDRPPEPTEAAKRAAERYRTRVQRAD